MNPLFLFAVGVILGVLVSMGFIIRMKNDHALVSSQQTSEDSTKDGKSTTDGDNTAQRSRRWKSGSGKSVGSGQSVGSTFPTSNNNQQQQLQQSQLASVRGGTATNLAGSRDPPLIKKKQVRWSPGRPGSLDKFKSAADSATAEFVTGNHLSTASANTPSAIGIDTVRSSSSSSSSSSSADRAGSVKDRKQKKMMKMVKAKNLQEFLPSQQGTGMGEGLTMKQIKAAKLLKRKYNKNMANLEKQQQQQQQQQQGGGGDRTSGSSVGVTAGGINSNLASFSKSNADALKSAKITFKTAGITKSMARYHSQVYRDYSAYRPTIPTYAGVEAEGKKAKTHRALPDMRLQSGGFEKDNLKLHLCNSVFEAYSASYLTTKHHMLHVQSEGYNLSWVNCEMASFIHMKGSNSFYSQPMDEGVVMQSLDVLDFSVIHLSAYERSHNKHRNILWNNRRDMVREWHVIDPVIQAGQRLQALNDPKLRTRNITYSAEAQRTVVVMPFLGGAMGAGHSKLNNRYEYLKTCFWSLYEFFPHIVAGVSRQEDVDWCMKESGMPFYDSVLLPNLPKSAGLPVGLTQQTKLRLLDGRWDFDYVFFTESDQILISRELPMMYAHLKKYPGHMMLPHRLMPYSNRAIAEVHKRDISNTLDGAWSAQRCCMQRQNCRERKNWLPLRDPKVPIINYYGLYVPLGNVNFLAEQYRHCTIIEGEGIPGEDDFCP